MVQINKSDTLFVVYSKYSEKVLLFSLSMIIREQIFY